METLSSEVREGTKVKYKGRMGEVVYVNRQLKAYQVMFSRDYGELVPFEDVRGESSGKMR